MLDFGNNDVYLVSISVHFDANSLCLGKWFSFIARVLNA